MAVNEEEKGVDEVEGEQDEEEEEDGAVEHGRQRRRREDRADRRG